MRNSITWSAVVLSGVATLFSAGCSHTQNMVGMNLPLEESPQMIMARTAEENGQFVKAEQTYRVMLQRNPKNVTALHRMGIVSSKMGRHSQATRHLMEAVKAQPDNSQLLTDLGYALYLQNDLPAAEIALEEAIKRDSSSKRSFNNLSLVLGHQGRMDEAYQVARSVLSAEEAHANIGYICLQRGMLDDAARHYNQALEINPDLDSVKEAAVQVAKLQKKQMEQAQPQSDVQLAESAPNETAPAAAVETVATETAAAPESEFRMITDAEADVINPEMIPANETPVAQISGVRELPIQGFEPPLNVSNDDYIPSDNRAFFETVESAQSVTNVRSAE